MKGASFERFELLDTCGKLDIGLLSALSHGSIYESLPCRNLDTEDKIIYSSKPQIMVFGELELELLKTI